MSVELNHTIVAAKDRLVSAGFLARILGLEVGDGMGSFSPGGHRQWRHPGLRDK